MTRIKICGITSLEDALAAVELGADALGFNFYEKSPRYISPEKARQIIRELPPEIEKVGVFVNSSLSEIENVCAESGIEMVQLHGDETPEFVAALSGPRVIKALRVSDDFQPEIALRYAADRFLLDTDCNGFGGSGKTFDWRVAAAFKDFGSEFFLAGGLTVENVAEAIREIRPYGVDVCSGVESVKGKKDMKKLEAFIRNARMAL